jgi:hypothetical protein
MKSASSVQDRVAALVLLSLTLGVIWLFYPWEHGHRHSPIGRIKAEMVNLVAALERCRTEIGNGQYPFGSTDDPKAVNDFLARAFPK